MSTPGRKRVQPILIDDDDDNEPTTTTNTEILTSSSSSSLSPSKTHIPLLTPLISAPTPELSPSLIETKASTKKNLYVPLNFDELSHIRNAQTNSEFATLLYDFKLYKDVVNGHICFSCRKVKFTFIYPGVRCIICLQRICKKCQRRITFRQNDLCFVSLNLLRRSSITSITNDMTLRRTEKTDSESSITTSKCKQISKRKLSHQTFTCCMDCFILFDPTTLV